jgi:hypothetical protein
VKTTIALFLASMIMTAAPMMEREKLEKMAESANSPKEHAFVSKQYRLQAEEFERKAAKHEADARKLQSAHGNPIAHKWPAMAARPSVKERQLAMEARRAAAECLEAADRHMRLSVEKLAEADSIRRSRSNSLD